MEKRNPPSYTSFASGASMRPTAAEADALLNHLAERADEQYMLDEEYLIGAEVLLKRETEPIRNMLEFTLSMDYQCYSAASISTSDREHFIHMAEASRQLRTTLGQPTGPRTAEVRPTPEERQVLAAYFWKYLHEPCKALSLPLDCVYNDIVHLGRYTHEHGGYKGSVFGILQQYGVMRLASKLYMDREFLIPRVFSDYNTQIKMIQAVNKVEQLYFVRISGFEGSTRPDSGPSGWSRAQNGEYEANERGIAYVFSRRAAIARACKDLSVGYWAKAVGECVEGIVARFRLVKAGERTADYTWASWRGERDKLPEGISPRSEVRNPPGGWRRVMSYHIPDYFEFRDQIEMHDC